MDDSAQKQNTYGKLPWYLVSVEEFGVVIGFVSNTLELVQLVDALLTLHTGWVFW